MNAEALTPLPDVYFESDRVRIHIPFPSWVDTDHMGINLLKTQRLMNIGGIKHVRLVGDINGERTVSMPVSVSVNPDGSASAGMGRAIEATKSLSLDSKVEGRRLFFKNAEWTSATIHINLEEIQRKIEEKKGNLRNADSWVPYVDHALRWGVRKAGTEHLLTRFTGLQKFYIFLVNIHNNLLLASNLSIMDILAKRQPIIPSANDLLAWTGINFALWSTFNTIMLGLENRSGSGWRLSIFPGYEIDRAAVLQVLSRTNKLVKTIPSEK